ncbi:NAD(P)-binding protein [Leucogyrophana mollusca]|uniref:NAD(P)-binding protein n=1 Tax=Leucogyrophana mollusca TaxID=85980 RepID=A0ACB8B3J2_9AGAM|nr:NAD(P)-binding protein [Leucogyrophana mollusca]
MSFVSASGDYLYQPLPSLVPQGAHNPCNWSLSSSDLLYELSPAEKIATRFSVEGNAIITGGCGHFGLEIARALLEHGASGVSLFDVNPTRSHIVINQLRLDFPSANIIAKTVDVHDEHAVQRAVAETVVQLGSVNMLLCFAGIENCNHALLVGLEEWRHTLGMNVASSWHCARAVARCMIQQGTGGSIVFTASISAHSFNFPLPRVSNMGMSRGTLPASPQPKSSAAAEWARYGIRVNSISPGYMDSIYNDGIDLGEARRMWASRKPAGRMGDPSELTGTVVLLCSRAGKYINGADILVDGALFFTFCRDYC